MRQLGHRPGLDQLRGVAVLAVMVQHTFPGHWLVGASGAVGVWLFFVLSGFLITRLLLEEGTIDRRAFYLRRARRLLPALPLAVVLMVAINVVLGVGSGPGVVGVMTYTSNFSQYEAPVGAFGAMWSLAIEEQFYLVWPLVVGALVPGRLGRFALAWAVVGWLARWALAPSLGAAYFLTWFRADALLAGAALACVARFLRPQRWTIVLAALVLVGFGMDTTFRHALGWGGGIISLSCVVLVAAAVHIQQRRPVLEHAGRIAYGLYLFHGPIALLFDELDWWMPLTWPVAFGLAELSWRLIERRWLGHFVGRGELDDVTRRERSGERLARRTEATPSRGAPAFYANG